MIKKKSLLNRLEKAKQKNLKLRKGVRDANKELLDLLKYIPVSKEKCSKQYEAGMIYGYGQARQRINLVHTKLGIL